jgi:hypothetical protein
LSGLTDEGQKEAFRREREEEIPLRMAQPDDDREHSEEDSR